jgi:hypothetical protein
MASTSGFIEAISENANIFDHRGDCLRRRKLFGAFTLSRLLSDEFHVELVVGVGNVS